MNKLLFTAAALAMLTACSMSAKKADSQTDATSENTTAQTSAGKIEIKHFEVIDSLYEPKWTSEDMPDDVDSYEAKVYYELIADIPVSSTSKAFNDSVMTAIFGEALPADSPELVKMVKDHYNTEEYRDFLNYYPMYENNYCTFSDRYELIYQDENFVTLFLTSYAFTGGVHGNGALIGQTFKTSDGVVLKWKDIFRDANLANSTNNALTPYIRKGLSKYFDMSEAELFDSEESFLDCPTDKIPMPTTAPWVEKDSLAFIYEPYEIASYAAGAPTFKIAIKDTKDLLSDGMKSIIK